MNNAINTQLSDALFSILRTMIYKDAQITDENKLFIAENIAGIYKLAKRHDISHFVLGCLSDNGIQVDDEELQKKIKKQMLVAVVRYERIEHELISLCHAFETEKIQNIPLKGAVLRKYYPEPWMRTSCDIDILVHKEDVEKAVLLMVEKLGYKENGKSGHDISLISESGVNVELHFALIEDDRINSADKVLSDVWDYTIPCDGYEYRMLLCDEMLYFYHISHMAKHFQIGGCGIKPLLDHVILCEKVYFDREKRKALLTQGNLLTFEEAVTHLCNVWMGKQEHTKITFDMEQYILYGGVYGNADNKSDVEQIKHGGKFRYLTYKIWLPYDQMKSIYPSLEKCKCLLPLYEVRRWARLVFKGGIKRYKKEIEIISTKSDEKVSKTLDMMTSLGLEIK